MSQKVPKSNLSRFVRRRRVIELKAQGLTIEEISKQLSCSEKTIDRDLKSQDVQKFLDELVRQQILDIKKAKLPTRLNYRSDLLDKLLPKKTEQKIEGGESYRVEIIDNNKDSVPPSS